jgi:hypothetical protein
VPGAVSGPFERAAARWPAARFADASAHRPVVVISSSTTVAPHPAMIHQPARLASEKPVRKDACRAESTADPITATPREVPTWRLVEAIAAATPECDRGMPDTALLVIAGFACRRRCQRPDSTR